MKYLATSILAIAGMAMTVSQASATTNPELILGFQQINQSTGAAFGNNLEVDLGAATQYFGSGAFATTTGPQTIAHLGTDLMAQYNTASPATTWQTVGNVFFGVIGAEQSNFGATAPDGLPKGTLYASRSRPSVATQSTPWSNNTQAAQKQSNSSVQTLYAGFDTGTPGTAPGAVVLPTGDNGSYSTQENIQQGLQFNYFQGSIDHAISFASGNPISDLYQIEPTNGASPNNTVNLLGAFELLNNGDLVYSNNPSVDFAPVPEPATLGFGMAMIGAVAFRRFRTSAIA